MKAVLLLIGISLASLVFWITMGAVILYTFPQASGIDAAVLAIVGYFGTFLIGISTIISKPKED